MDRKVVMNFNKELITRIYQDANTYIQTQRKSAKGICGITTHDETLLPTFSQKNNGTLSEKNTSTQVVHFCHRDSTF